MTYDPQIPLVTESPKDSASPIQVNFDQFAKIFSALVGGIKYNHIDLNNAQQGKHSAVLFQKQTLDPGVTQDLAVLYAKDVASQASIEPQLFAQIPKFLPTDLDTTNATNAPMQLTYNKVNVAGPVYQSFMAGGYIVYFGNVTTAISPQTVTLSPIPKKILIAIALPNTVDADSIHQPIKISTNITSTSTFDVYTVFTGGPRTFNFIAVAQA